LRLDVGAACGGDRTESHWEGRPVAARLGFEPRQLDHGGLREPPDPPALALVDAAVPNPRGRRLSPGPMECTRNQLPCPGHTYQQECARVLDRLSGLHLVDEILEVQFDSCEEE
jgi:hypothetical protein